MSPETSLPYSLQDASAIRIGLMWASQVRVISVRELRRGSMLEWTVERSSGSVGNQASANDIRS